MKRLALALALVLAMPAWARAIYVSCGDGWVGDRVDWTAGQLLRADNACQATFQGGTLDAAMIGTGTTWADKVIPRCTGSQVLTFNSGGSFACVTGGGGGTPAGTSGDIQYNNAGAFGGTSLLRYNSTLNRIEAVNTTEPTAGGEMISMAQSHFLTMNVTTGTLVGYDSSPAVVAVGSAPIVIGFRAGGLVRRGPAEPLGTTSQLSTFVSRLVSRSNTPGEGNAGQPARRTIGYLDNNTVRQQTGTASAAEGMESFFAYPRIEAKSTAQFTVPTWDGLHVAPVIMTENAAGKVTVPLRRGVYIADITHECVTCGTISVPYNVGIYIDPLTKGVLNHSIVSLGTETTMIHAGTARFGDTLTPSTGTYGIELAAPIHVVEGDALAYLFRDGTTNSFLTTFATAGAGFLDAADVTWTMDAAFSGLVFMAAHNPNGSGIGTTFSFTEDSTFGVTAVSMQPRYEVVVTSAQPGGVGIKWSPDYRPTGAGVVWTLEKSATVEDQPDFQTSGGGTYGSGSHRLGFLSTPRVPAGVTFPAYSAIEINPREATGTLTTHVGVNIGKLVATTPLGFFNSSTTGFPASTKTNWAAAETLTANATSYNFTVTGAGNIVVTAVPSISDGYYEGQILILQHTESGAQVLTLQDETALAGSNLRLSWPVGIVCQWDDDAVAAGTQCQECGNVHVYTSGGVPTGAGLANLKYRDTITFKWDGTDWVEIACADNSAA